MPLSTVSTSVPVGVLTGSSPVVGLGVPSETPLLRVKLGWQCSSDGESWRDATPRGRSYVVDLDAMECGVRQKLALAVHEDTIAWSPYGNPNWQMSVETAEAPRGRAFLYQDGPLLVRGTVRVGRSGVAELDLEEATLADFPVCTPGTYALAAL
jgi:hypothetical protein